MNTLEYVPHTDVYLLDGQEIKGKIVRQQLDAARKQYYAATDDAKARGEPMSLYEEIVSSIALLQLLADALTEWDFQGLVHSSDSQSEISRMGRSVKVTGRPYA